MPALGATVRSMLAEIDHHAVSVDDRRHAGRRLGWPRLSDAPCFGGSAHYHANVPYVGD